MKVTFANFGAEIASTRLRAIIPQRELGKLGVEPGRDALVYGKHFLTASDVAGYGRLVFDICDDHFNHATLGPYYREHADRADVVTCNSVVMQQRIKIETGRDAVLVREPYESPEMEPAIGPFLLWYGHQSNFADLQRIEGDLEYPLLALSNHPLCVEWTLKVFRDAISKPCIVIIPTGKSQAKSENRMVEAIRCGRYVCAEHLPAYEPFDRFMPLGDIPAHIELALGNPEAATQAILAAQDYIRDTYSPQAIARQWLEVINGIDNLQRA